MALWLCAFGRRLVRRAESFHALRTGAGNPGFARRFVCPFAGDSRDSKGRSMSWRVVSYWILLALAVGLTLLPAVPVADWFTKILPPPRLYAFLGPA